MLSNHLRDFYCLIIIVLVVNYGHTKTCIPKQIRLLSNCSFQLTTNNNNNRALSMVVPYSFGNQNDDDEQRNFISLFRHKKTSKAIIRLNLNFIQCTNQRKQIFNWTSLESSSTLRGEFLRTINIENNLMYLPSGKIFLKNFTSIDCLTNTFYRTDDQQIFELDLKIESTLNDFCLNDHSCQPEILYQCDQLKQRCSCRQPFQIYSHHEKYPICLQTVQTMDQCLNKHIRCVDWCHFNRSSSTMCLCPQEYSKKISDNNQTYCESQTGGKCNKFLQCPFNDQCLDGICQNPQHQSHSFDMLTLSIIISSLVFFFISILFGISLCILRRQRWKKDYHPPSDSHCKTQQEIIVPTMSNYDNVTYNAFRHNIHLSSSDDNESSPVTTSDECSYEPKVIYLGGEQQLTAIFA